jgi:tetratricopeptide (TPR) repeat protein
MRIHILLITTVLSTYLLAGCSKHPTEAPPALTDAFRPDSSSPWVGKTVFIDGSSSVWIGKNRVDIGSRIGPFKVTYSRGDWLWIGVGWLQAQDAMDTNQAFDFWNSKVVSEPYNSSNWTARGIIWCAKGEDEIAVKDFTESLRIEPTNYYTLANRGLAFQRLRKYPEALADIDSALQINTGDANLYVVRSALLVENDLEGALRDANEAVRMAPNDASYFARARIYAIREEVEKSLDDVNEAIRLAPTRSAYYSFRGTLRFAGLQDIAGAIRDLEKAIDLDPTEPVGYLSLAKIREVRREPEEAARLYDRAVELSKNHPIAFESRADSRALRGDWSGAVLDYRDAISLSQDEAERKILIEKLEYAEQRQ